MLHQTAIPLSTTIWLKLCTVYALLLIKLISEKFEHNVDLISPSTFCIFIRYLLKSQSQAIGWWKLSLMLISIQFSISKNRFWFHFYVQQFSTSEGRLWISLLQLHPSINFKIHIQYKNDYSSTMRAINKNIFKWSTVTNTTCSSPKFNFSFFCQ